MISEETRLGTAARNAIDDGFARAVRAGSTRTATCGKALGVEVPDQEGALLHSDPIALEVGRSS